jgi:hypothetical protein
MPQTRFARPRFMFAIAALLLCSYATSDAAAGGPGSSQSGAPQSSSPRKMGKTTFGDYSIEQSPKDMLVARLDKPGEPILSFRAMAESDWAMLTKDAPDKPMQSERSYRILSAVGPFLSVEEQDDCDCGGAHPTASRHFRAFDLRKSSRDHPAFTSLTDIFPEEAVFAALRGDKLVASALKDVEDPPPASLPELLKAIQVKPVQVGECSYNFRPDLLTDFAFYSIEADDVSVRISLSHAAEVCRGQMTQIGIRLPIPVSLKSGFDAAREGKSGLLMVRAKRGAEGTSMTFTFSTKDYRK